MEDQFSGIMSEYLPMMVSYASLRLPGRLKHDADDYANEAFLNLWRYISKLGYIPQISNMGAFLRVILLNVIRGRMRKKQTIFELGITMISSFLPNSQVDTPADEYLILFEQSELRFDLLQYIDKLPLAQRNCVILHYINELEYSEIAVLLNTSENNVRVNTFRGIKRLRAIYPRQEEGDGHA